MGHWHSGVYVMSERQPWYIHVSNFLAAVAILIALWSYFWGVNNVTPAGYAIGGASALTAALFRVAPTISRLFKSLWMRWQHALHGPGGQGMA